MVLDKSETSSKGTTFKLKRASKSVQTTAVNFAPTATCGKDDISAEQSRLPSREGTPGGSNSVKIPGQRSGGGNIGLREDR